MSVHSALAHDSASLHVTGQASYVDDLPLPPGSLHLAFGISQHAHARLQSLNLDRVRESLGVVTVLTARDLPFANDVSPTGDGEPLLAEGKVHYFGQPLFLVAATSHAAARRAARRATIEVEPLPALLSIKDAVKAGSHFGDGPLIWTRGDPDQVLRQSARRLAGELVLGGQEHFYLEGQVARATPLESGDMLIQASTQHPSEIQHKVAEALGCPMHSIRVETRRMGGAFGGKESQGNAVAVACAVAAHATGRCCAMRYDRDDDMLITGKRHDFIVEFDAGFDLDGRIRAVEFVHYVRCGWSLDLSNPVADRAMLHADNACFLPDVRITSHRLRTNTQSATAFRGFGGPQGMMGIERVLDEIAHTLNLDPADVHRINYYLRAPTAKEGKGKRRNDSAATAAEPETAPQTTHYGQPVRDFILHEMTDRLLDSSGYHTRRQAVAEWNSRGTVIRRGIGFAPVKFGISFTLTHLNQAGALVQVYTDGSILINHGGTEMGQGLFQKVAQVAAHEFGVQMDKIRVSPTDTARVPNTSATAASSGSDLNGMAVQAACRKICDRIALHLSRNRCLPSEVRFAEDKVTAGQESMSFAEAVQSAYSARTSLSATGYFRTPDLSWDRLSGRGRPFYYFACGAAAAEVAVDITTGEYRVLRVDILHDCGTSLNPALDIGQIEGGFVQGMGWLTSEELVWDAQGKLLTHAPSTYKIPAFADQPDTFNVHLWNASNIEPTIHRSKAVGEPPLMLAMSVFHALSAAASSCGPCYPRLKAPATPEQVLAAVQCARG